MGKIKRQFPNINIFVQPNSGDAGGAIGAALYANMKFKKNFINKRFKNPYLGPSYSNEFIKKSIIEKLNNQKHIDFKFFENFEHLSEFVASKILNNDVVGMVSGKNGMGS